jgi:hypothetical protein
LTFQNVSFGLIHTVLPIRIIWKAPFEPSENEPSQSDLFASVTVNVRVVPESEPVPVTRTLVAARARVSASALFPIASALSAASGSPVAAGDALELADPDADVAEPLDVEELPEAELLDELQPTIPAAAAAMRQASAACRYMVTNVFLPGRESQETT